MSWDATMEKVDTAIRALRAKGGAEPPIDQARLMVQAGLVLGPINDLPRSLDAGRNKTIKELDKFIKKASDLGGHILAMHSPALRAIESAQEAAKAGRWQHLHPLTLVDVLRSLASAAADARDALPPTDRLVSPKGRSKKNAAEFLAESALDAYQWYTGRRGTITTHPVTSKRGGEYLRFVQAIFGAVGIDADAATYALRAISNRKRKSSLSKMP